VDPHPAWDPTGRLIVFNGYAGRTRKVHVADVGELLEQMSRAPAASVQTNP
jgi:hypothetical protein